MITRASPPSSLSGALLPATAGTMAASSWVELEFAVDTNRRVEVVGGQHLFGFGSRFDHFVDQ